MTSSEFKLEKWSILPNFYFREVFEQLKPNIYANFNFERVLRFVIEYAWISELFGGAALTWQRGEMSCRWKNWLMFWKPTICWSPWYCMEWWQDGMCPWFQVSAKGTGEEGKKRGDLEEFSYSLFLPTLPTLSPFCGRASYWEANPEPRGIARPM